MREPIGSEVNAPAFERSGLEKIGGIDTRTTRTLESLPQARDIITASVNDLIEDTNAIEGEPLLTFADPNDPILTNTRKLVGGANVSATLGASDVDLDLTDTGVTAGAYGAATKLVILAIDAKGRVTAASEVTLESGNVTETTKLFFTDARARAAISGNDGIDYDSSSGAISMSHIPGVAGTHASPTSITVNDKGQITAIS